MKKFLSVVLVVASILSLCVLPVSADETVITVNSVEGLLSCVASNTRVIVESGKYIIPAERYTFDDGDYCDIGQSFTIQDVSNFHIEGNGYVEIALAVGDLPVVKIYNSENISITGITLGHDVPEYSCAGEGDVISVSFSNNIQINNCDLYGCGIVGIAGLGSGDITVNHSFIRDCETGAVEVWGMHGNLTLNSCSIVRNAYNPDAAEYYPCFKFSGDNENDITEQLVLNGCVVQDNLNQQGFDVEDAGISIYGGTFANNAWEGNIFVYVRKFGVSDKVYFEDQKPVIINGRTMIPARGVFETLNHFVDWNDAERIVKVTSFAGHVVEIPIDSTTIYVNGEPRTIDVPAQIINNRTMIPVRAVTEALGKTVEWDDVSKKVTIID